MFTATTLARISVLCVPGLLPLCRLIISRVPETAKRLISVVSDGLIGGGVFLTPVKGGGVKMHATGGLATHTPRPEGPSIMQRRG
jgi:hypothetical protein